MIGRAVAQWRRVPRLAATWAGRAPGEGAVVLGYHGVRDGVVRSDEVGYHVTPSAMARQLHQVRRAGFTIVSLADLVARVRASEPVDRLAAVTFDDGFAELAGAAMQVLEATETPATVFVVTEGAGLAPTWWPGQERTLDPSEVGALSASPLIEIGSHTRTHRSLPTVGDAELADELARSRADLEAWTDQPVRLLAYPSGHHDRRVRDAVAAAGYDAACTFRNGRMVAAGDLLRIPRMTMHDRHGTLRWTEHLSRPADQWPATQLDHEYAADDD